MSWKIALPKDSRPCRKCGEPILFVTTTEGGTMPMDYGPSTGGTFILVESPDDGELVGLHVTKAAAWGISTEELEKAPRRMSHFATCPRADHFRIRRS